MTPPDVSIRVRGLKRVRKQAKRATRALNKLHKIMAKVRVIA